MHKRMIGVSLYLGLCATTIQAQTTFQPYDTTVTLSRYRSVEECLAAVSRVTDSFNFARPEFPDTIPFKKGEGRDSTPAPAITIARQCVEKFNPDSVALQDYTDWMRLYLLASRDDAAEVVARRRIASARQQPKSPRDLYDVLMAVVQTYGGVRPVRWDKVQSNLVLLEEKGVAPGALELYSVYYTGYQIAENVNDTVVQERMGERVVKTAETFPPEIKATMQFMFVRYTAFQAANFLTRAARMDSLRRGPVPYVTLVRANWNRLDQNNFNPVPMSIGKQAPPLVADFWFTSSTVPLATTSDHPRPSPGKVALVVFLREGCNARTPIFTGGLDRATFWMSCWSAYASMRRLAQRFPSLEITVVSRTTGYIGETSPMAPRDEVLILQKWWLGFHRLPATLAVTNTEFFRLEEADRRRIDQPVENEVNYLFGEGQGNEIQSQMAYLIDTNGMVLFSGGLASWSEWTIAEMLDVMTQR